jgi:hypothetical protein
VLCLRHFCRFGDETQHLENTNTEVTGERGAMLARKLSNAAKQWWQSVIAEPSSFQKPTFYLGFGNWTVTNMLAAGAHERTPERVQLMINGATGFYNAGDSMCFKLKVSVAAAATAAAGVCQLVSYMSTCDGNVTNSMLLKTLRSNCCYVVQVLTPGVYTATADYTSKLQATFKLSVGSFASIKAGTARTLTLQWPAQVRMALVVSVCHT